MNGEAAKLITLAVESLWLGAIAATPLGLIVGALCRVSRISPATRHMLWCAVLVSFISPTIGALIWRPDWFRSDRVLATAEAVLPRSSPAASKPAPLARARTLDLPAPDSALQIRDSRPARTQDPDLQSRLDLADASLRNSAAFAEPVTNLVKPADSVTNSSALFEAALHRQPEVAALSLGDPAPKVAGHATSAPEQAAPPRETIADVRLWLSRLLHVRDSIASVPPVPAAVWIVGTLLFVAVGVVRAVIASRWIRGARPAGPEIRSMVREVADSLGLSTPPETVIVRSTVSPMIWCGLRPRLVLPESLWLSLDADSRRAVLVHELAHVRRGDHLLCWLQNAIGAVYWWHPVAWWARRRLADEAEASCDAWVTSLFPASRRAYASVLVATKSYLSIGRGQGPGLGITSGSARKLARRITMVMTQRTAPKMSVFGGCAAALIVALGTFVTPGLACPPEGESEGQATPAKAPKPANAPKAKANAKAPRAADASPGVTFLGEAPALEMMRPGQPVEVDVNPLVVTRRGQPLELARPGHPMVVSRMGQLAPLPQIHGQPAEVTDLESLKVGREMREYAMPEGKLECFFEFMSRADVPILVERHQGGIGIWGTKAEHETFGAFLAIVSPGAQSRAPVAAEHLRLESLARAQVQARDASSRQRAVLQDLNRNRAQIERDAESARAAAERTRERADQVRELYEQLHERSSDLNAAEDRAALEDAIRRLRSRSETLNAKSSTLEQRVHELERQMEAIESQLEALEEQLDDADEGAEEIEVLFETTPEPTTGAATLPFWQTAPVAAPAAIPSAPSAISAPRVPATPALLPTQPAPTSPTLPPGPTGTPL